MSNPNDYLNRLRQRQPAAPAAQPSAPAPPTENLRQTQQKQDWDNWDEVLRQRESQKSVSDLHWDAYSAYSQEQNELAASLFAEAAELARQQGDISAQANSLTWEGDSLQYDDHLTKALARLFEANSLNALDSIGNFYNLINIVSVARRIPLPLIEQQKLQAKLEPYKGNQQIGGSKSMVLYAESEFLSDCGMCSEALAKSQEAFASRVDCDPSCNNKVYFNVLIHCYRMMGQHGEARKILQRWISEASYDHANEKSWILKADAILLYSEGHPEAAWDKLWQAHSEERYIYRAEREVDTLQWMIRLGSELGYFEQIRPIAFLMLRFRHSESLHTRYSCYLSLARYCCHVCIRGGLSAEDTVRMYRHSRFWLRKSEETARKLDQLLECDWRTKQVQKLRDQYAASL